MTHGFSDARSANLFVSLLVPAFLSFSESVSDGQFWFVSVVLDAYLSASSYPSQSISVFLLSSNEPEFAKRA